MTLLGESKVMVYDKTGQMVILIPAKMTSDSQFGFKAGDVVLVTYLPNKRSPVLVVHRQRSDDIKIRKKKEHCAMTTQEFWANVKSFPLGLHCDKFAPDQELPGLLKDCGTCHYLRLGKCSRNKIPTIKGETKVVEP